MIKTTTKTNLKIFLVPYDLTANRGDAKSVLRQKHFIGKRLKYAVHVVLMRDISGSSAWLCGAMRVVFSGRVWDGEVCEVVTSSPEFGGAADDVALVGSDKRGR